MRTYDEILNGMKEKYKELSGFEADDTSDIGIRLKVLAQQIYSIDSSVDFFEKQMFAGSADGHYLDMHAAQRGLERKAAKHSKGTVRFSRDSAGTSAYVIPAGTIVSTKGDDPLRFETTAQGTIPAGQSQALVPVISVEPGADNNVAPGAVQIMITPVQGVSSVTNTEQFTGGIDEESDEGLRNRLLQSYFAISNGTNSAFYYDEAMKHDGITSAKVLPRKRGRGTVDIVLSAAGANPDQALISEIQNDIAYKREVNVDVTVTAARERMENVTAAVGIDDNDDFDMVKQRCEDAVRSFFRGLNVGEPLRRSALGNVLYQCDGVINYTLTAPGGDVRPDEDQIVRLGTLTVTRMAVV